MNKRQSYLILNPYDFDAQEFIDAMSDAFGLRPICIYTDPKERFYTERAMPHLKTLDPEEEVFTSIDDLDAVVDELNTRYDIRAVIPFREYYVEACAAMLDRCDVNWMAGRDLALFRDKHRQKTEIAKRDPSVRVPTNRIVRTVDDIYEDAPDFDFVLKPNDGAGSTNLGFFTSDDRAAIEAHLAKAPGETWILEERIAGPEFRINGQVRRDGTVQVLLITEYVPMKLSDTFTLAYSTEIQLRTDDERWDMLVGYTERILRAGGLWGSPFHLEVKVDDNGPAMVDLGGRLASDGSGFTMSVLHPDRPDIYAVAARDYVGDNDLAMEPPRYDHYNEWSVVSLSGISYSSGYLLDAAGMEKVEALPEFLRWVVRPPVGEWIDKTRDLRSCPYLVLFRHQGDRDDVIKLRDWVYETIELRTEPELKPWSSLRIRGIANKMRSRSRWMVESR